jgi:hypothetical protein
MKNGKTNPLKSLRPKPWFHLFVNECYNSVSAVQQHGEEKDQESLVEILTK